MDPAADELPSPFQGLASFRKARVPHCPGMDHVRPDLQRDVDIGETQCTRKTDGVVDQCFG